MHTSADLLATAPLVEELVGMLSNIGTVILGGKAAQRQWTRHAPAIAADWTVINCPHPSPQNVNTRPEAREQIVEAWRAAAAVI